MRVWMRSKKKSGSLTPGPVDANVGYLVLGAQTDEEVEQLTELMEIAPSAESTKLAGGYLYSISVMISGLIGLAVEGEECDDDE